MMHVAQPSYPINSCQPTGLCRPILDVPTRISTVAWLVHDPGKPAVLACEAITQAHYNTEVSR